MTLHHPKEDDYLFRRLRNRTSSVDAELDELRDSTSAITSLSPNLGSWSTAIRWISKCSEQAVSRYARFMGTHGPRGRDPARSAEVLTAEAWSRDRPRLAT